MSIRAIVQDETTKIQECISKMTPSDNLLSECLRQEKPPSEEEELKELSWQDEP